MGAFWSPEPVLGETCNFLRNHVRNGAALEVTLLDALTGSPGNFEIVDPTSTDRFRATELARQLVSGPLGYVDGIILAMAERLKVPNIASADFEFLGMAALHQSAAATPLGTTGKLNDQPSAASWPQAAAIS